MMNRYCMIIMLILLNPAIPAMGLAGWTGPSDVINEDWGAANNQIGFKAEDTADTFPEGFWILGDQIVVRDQVNRRMKIYNINGQLQKIVNWLKQQDGSYKINEYPLAGITVGYIDNNLLTYYPPQRDYGAYSPTGQLIKTSASRPLELGQIEMQSQAGGKYKYILKYANATYSIISDTIFEEGLTKDRNNNIYGIGSITDPKDVFISSEWEGNTVSETPIPHYIVSRFSPCGKQIARVDLPAAVSRYRKTTTGVVRDESALRQYGKPIVAVNGDVYTWQRTSDKYSILKWTWVDDPNMPTGPDAPTGLTLMPSTTGLYLTWTASPSDPGCVTGYEVARATSAGGATTTDATVNAGVVKYNDTTADAGTTYYYKVRAKAGSEYSPYTSEVSGKR